MKKVLIFFGLLILVLAICFYRPPIGLEKLKQKYTDEHSKYIEINGMNVHYSVQGEGPPLLLIHGTSSSFKTWEKWVEILAPNFKTYSIDMPGSGLTGPHPNDDYSNQSYIDFLEKFCKKMEFDSIYLAGNSLGGKTAWKFAAKNDIVKKLILVDPSGFYSENRKTPLVFKLGENKLLSRFSEYLNVKPFINKSLKEVFFDDEKISKDLKVIYSDFMRRKGNRRAFFQKVSSIELSDEKELLEISCPTLIQWGENDNWISVDLAEIFMRNIKNYQYKVYAECGHVPQEEIPIESVNDAQAFLLVN